MQCMRPQGDLATTIHSEEIGILHWVGLSLRVLLRPVVTNLEIHLPSYGAGQQLFVSIDQIVGYNSTVLYVPWLSWAKTCVVIAAISICMLMQ